jgi:flagellar capping protein FliD
LSDTQRSGLTPLLESRTAIYTDNWFSAVGHGDRVERLFALPELERNTWKKRTNAIRIALGAFWSLVYEEGHAKSEAMHRQNLQHPKASFQLGSDLSVLAFRLCYPLSGKGAKDVLSYFWPSSAQPTHPVQLLHRYCDFVRVHLISETNDIEIVAGFFPSAPAEKAFGQLHTLWIEPISARTVSEIPYELPSPQNPLLTSFPLTGAESIGAPPVSTPSTVTPPSPNTVSLGASSYIIPTQTLGDLSSIDPQTLLNTFSERYQETTAKILALETELNRLTKMPDTSDFEKRSLANRLEKLTTRQNEWGKQLVALLEQFRAQQNRMRRAG